MSLNLLVSIIIYALMAFFVGCGFYHIVNLSKYQKDFALIGKRIKTDARLLLIYRSILTERLASKTNYFSLIN